MKAAFKSVQSLLDQMMLGRQRTFCCSSENRVTCFTVVYDVSIVMCATQQTKGPTPWQLCTPISMGILEYVLVPCG